MRTAIPRWLAWLTWLAPLALGACAAIATRPSASPQGKVTAQMRSGSPELHAFQIEDWVAPDDRTLIVNGADRSVFAGRFRGECPGLHLADTIAFIVPGAARLETYTGIVLADGRRCLFASFTRLVTPPARTKEAGSNESL